MHPFKQDQQNENIHLHKNIIEHKRKMAVQFFFFIQIGKLIRKMLVQSRGIRNMELIDYWCRIFQTRHHGRKMNWYCYILKLGNLWNMYWLHKPHELKNPSCTFSSLMEKCVTQRKIFKKHFIIFDIGKHAKLALQGPAIFLKNVMRFPSQFSNTKHLSFHPEI